MEEANIGLTMIRIYLPLSSIGCAMARFFAPPPGPRTGKRLCAWLLRILGSPLWWKDCAKTDEGRDIVTHVANTPRKRKKTTVAEYLELNLKNAGYQCQVSILSNFPHQTPHQERERKHENRFLQHRDNLGRKPPQVHRA